MFLGGGSVMDLIFGRYLLFFVLAEYFEALNPLPPCKNKIKELVKAMAKIFKIRISVPEPEAAG